MLPKDFQKKLDERIARAASRGFTREYQNAQEHEDKLHLPQTARSSNSKEIRGYGSKLGIVSQAMDELIKSCRSFQQVETFS